MKNSRTVLLITGLSFFIIGIMLALSYSQNSMHNTINEILNSRLTHDGSSKLTVREHIEFNDRIRKIEVSLENMHKEKKISSEQVKQLIESKINSARQADVTTSSIADNQNNRQTQSIHQGNPSDFEEAHYNNLEEAFFTGELDPQFTATLTGKLEESFEEIRSQTASNASVIDMDCKTDMCRVEVSFTDDETGEAANFLELSLLQKTGGKFGTSSSRNISDEDGKVKSTIYYLSRPSENEQQVQHAQPPFTP